MADGPDRVGAAATPRMRLRNTIQTLAPRTRLKSRSRTTAFLCAFMVRPVHTGAILHGVFSSGWVSSRLAQLVGRNVIEGVSQVTGG